MKIGIIGAGAVGATLAGKFVALEHDVAIANSRGAASLINVAQRTGARAVYVVEAARGADLLMIAVPERAMALLPGALFDALPAVAIIVDTCNYYPSWRDGEIEPIERGAAESRWVADTIGRGRVVKAFNSIAAAALADGGMPAGSPGRIALPVAGDDAEAKAVVVDLVEAIGFDAIDAGLLDESWRQQPGSPAYCTDLDVVGLRRALAVADRMRLPEMREKAVQALAQLSASVDHAGFTAVLRSLQY